MNAPAIARRLAGGVLAVLLLGPVSIPAAKAQGQPPAKRPVAVEVQTSDEGSWLVVQGEPFLVKGMNWDYFPIGTNYLYDLWSQSDEFIVQALEDEMPLMQAMGVNAIRVYAGIPPRWVQYIYEHYGIWTIVNHPMARYGYTLDGVWMPNTDYGNPRLRAAVTEEITQLVKSFEGTPGLLMWLLGNENNYGLSWTSFEAEALPEGEEDQARARQLYSLYEEVTRAVKAVDSLHPVAIANGDIQYLDLIAQECKSLDILGTNVYRGISVGDLYQRVHDALGLPVMYTEFGADAFNAKEMREDQLMQARYLVGQWREIYEQTRGKGRVGNAIGGCIFQWSDGWWKYGQDSFLDVHDTHASWPNGGYVEDYVPGENNMNEEWWGICAKGPTDAQGFYELYPRAAWYAMREAFALDAYAPATDLEAVRVHFGAIHPVMAKLQARGDKAARMAQTRQQVHLSGLRLEFETYSTGGKNITTPDAQHPQEALPAFRGFDHMQSFYADFEVKPTEAVTGELSLNVVGNVPVNRIDEIFYENRGRRTPIVVEGEEIDLQGLERVSVYRAAVAWEDRLFHLDAFYRTGHTHWGYEGDFFGLYHDAYYGENIDIYNGVAPVGVELAGKKWMEGLKVAFGPELWWGANPAVLVKYRRQVGPFDATAIFQEDFARQNTVTSSIAIPLPENRKATLSAATDVGPFGLELGTIWSGSPLKGRHIYVVEEENGVLNAYDSEIEAKDTWGGKARLTYESGRWHWYGEGAYEGAVAYGGPTAITTYTGWTLKDTGVGNQARVASGLAVDVGRFQISPKVVWQKPLIGPIPADAPAPARPRNVQDDPFAVRGNREMTAFELLLSYDPTPATWMWAWDNIEKEDAPLAWSIGYTFRHMPTTMDAAIYISEGGDAFPFPGATPPRDLWEVRARVVSRLNPQMRLVANLYGGLGEPNGDDPRKVQRYGGDATLAWGRARLGAFVKVNDWGPYDYHRDFNLTFPLQLMADVSWSLGQPRWFDFPQTRLGVRTTWRTLDQYSPRYILGSGEDGREWEIRTYLHVSL